MAITLGNLDEIKKSFRKVKVGKELTEESARANICDYTENLLRKNDKDKNKAIKGYNKVIKKVGNSFQFLMYYGVESVLGATISAKDEDDAVAQALDYCELVRRGKAGAEVDKLIKAAFDKKKKTIANRRPRVSSNS